MAFETLPPEYQSFFDTGELPASMQGEAEAAAAEAARVAAEQAANDEAVRVAAGQPQVVTPPVVTPPVTEPALIDPAPQAPTSNPYLERLLAERDNQQAALQKQLADAQEQLKKLTEVAPPDPMTDPLGFLAHKIDATQKEIAALRASQTQVTEQQAQQAEVNAFLQNVDAHVKAFTATHPDYNDAYKHLATMRMQDFKDVGMTDAQAKQAFGQEEVGITQRALQMGKNPAEIAYGMATRYGYKAGAVTPVTPNTPAAVKVADDKLDAIKKGLEASKEATRGVPVADVADVANLRNMSDKDLNKLVESDWDSVFGKSKGIFG